MQIIEVTDVQSDLTHSYWFKTVVSHHAYKYVAFWDTTWLNIDTKKCQNTQLGHVYFNADNIDSPV